jgi:hypothetical protein
MCADVVRMHVCTRLFTQRHTIASTAVRASRQHWRNARFDEIRYNDARRADTAAQFQAMGNPLRDGTERSADQ